MAVSGMVVLFPGLGSAGAKFDKSIKKQYFQNTQPNNLERVKNVVIRKVVVSPIISSAVMLNSVKVPSRFYFLF